MTPLPPADEWAGPAPGPFELDTEPTRVDGAAPAAVRDALRTGESLACGAFAGAVDGRLVRDALGRRPVYHAAGDPTRYAFLPWVLDEPRLVPAGTVVESDGTERAVWTVPDPDPAPESDALAAVRSATREAVRAGSAAKRTAIAYSGGVDSAFVAWGRPAAQLYVAGFEGCHDRAAAREAAAAAGRAAQLTEVPITHQSTRAATRAVAAATGRTNPMDVAIAVPLWHVGRRAARDGHGRLALGQGADELFGGYAKVVDPGDDTRVDAETVRGARRETVLSLPDQLARDVCTLRAAGVEPVTPFLTDAVIENALRLPGSLLADGDERKRALRLAAEGVPASARGADKKAVQYGTYVSRELDRLARQAGFKRRMDDHVGRYVEALVADELDERPA